MNSAAILPPPERARYGVLDIGSNSIRLVIYEIFGASFTPIYNEKVLAGLGRSLRKTGRLDPEGRVEARATIIRFKRISDSQGVERLIIGATAALREAHDAAGFIDDIAAETGLQIVPVSGPEEANLSALGLLAAMPKADGIAADLGGASLELIRVGGGQAGIGLSLPIGPFQMLGHDLGRAPFYPDVLRKTLREFIKASDTYKLKAGGEPLYLIGGAWRNLAAVHQKRIGYPLQTLQNYVLSPDVAKDMARWAYGVGRAAVTSWPHMSSKRAETLPYSALLLDVLLKVMKPSEVVISETGLREGLIYSVISEPQRRRDPLHDGCRHLAEGNLSIDNFGEPLFDFLKSADPVFPRVFKPAKEARLRFAACLLTGLGKGRHPDHRPAMVFEEILHAPLAGLSHKARAYLALILFRSFTNASKTPDEAAINELLSESERQAADIYGMALRLGVVSSGRSADLLKAFSLISAPKSSAQTLFLRVKPNCDDLMTGRVIHRLDKLNTALQSL